jgi:hypothetical protein
MLFYRYALTQSELVYAKQEQRLITVTATDGMLESILQRIVHSVPLDSSTY